MLLCLSIIIILILFFIFKQKKQYHIFDKENRICIYHGINVSNSSKYNNKYLPWQTKDDFKTLQQYGFNLVRYLVFWDALEPSENNYNNKYIEETRERIGWLQELGIDVIIDIHQDIYCKKFTGNGFPLWTCNDENIKFEQKTPWTLNLYEPAVTTSYKNFWNNEYLQQKYLDVVQLVYDEFANKFDNVIGVDIMNEPFPIVSNDLLNVIKEKNILALKSKYIKQIFNFEKQYLSKLINDIISRIKTDKKIIFEPVIYTSSGLPSNLKINKDSRIIYAPHYYDVFCHSDKPYNDYNSFLMSTAMKLKINESLKYKCPIIYGEWGISDKAENYLDFINDFYNLTEDYGIGWIYFSHDLEHPFSLFNEDKSPNEKLKNILQPYPQRIAGRNFKVVSYYEVVNDDNDILCFELKYDNIGLKSNTIIYLPYCLNDKINIETKSDLSFEKFENYTLIHMLNTNEKLQSIKIKVKE